MKNWKQLYVIILLIVQLIFIDSIKSQNVGITDGSVFVPISLLHLNENSALPVSVFQITIPSYGITATDGFLLKLESSFKVKRFNEKYPK